jgi:hypothetical protein
VPPHDLRWRLEEYGRPGLQSSAARRTAGADAHVLSPGLGL